MRYKLLLWFLGLAAAWVRWVRSELLELFCSRTYRPSETRSWTDGNVPNIFFKISISWEDWWKFNFCLNNNNMWSSWGIPPCSDDHALRALLTLWKRRHQRSRNMRWHNPNKWQPFCNCCEGLLATLMNQISLGRRFWGKSSSGGMQSHWSNPSCQFHLSESLEALCRPPSALRSGCGDLGYLSQRHPLS
jgi:hypothetical protein